MSDVPLLTLRRDNNFFMLRAHRLNGLFVLTAVRCNARVFTRLADRILDRAPDFMQRVAVVLLGVGRRYPNRSSHCDCQRGRNAANQ